MSTNKIIERAWQLTWKHRSMWLFGFLLAFFGASSGGIGGRGAQYSFGPQDRAAGPWLAGLVVLVVAAVIVLAIIGILVRHSSEGALIGMARDVEETGETTVPRGWHAGRSRFLSLFGIDVLIGIPAAIVVLMLLGLAASPLLLLMLESDAATALAIVATICLELLAIAATILLGTVLSLVRNLAYRHCVLSGSRAWASIREGLHLVRRHARRIAGVWLVMLGIGLAVTLVAIPFALITSAMVAGPATAVYSVTKQAAPAVIIGAVMAFLGGLVMSALMSVYETFKSVVWTLVYRDITAPPQVL